jgi:hypothetical protein
MSGLVGWKSSTDSNYSSIPFVTSSAGYYVNDLPGVTVGLLSSARGDQSVCDYITSIHQSEGLKVIDTFVAKQKKDLATKELLSNVTLIQDYFTLDYTISRSSRFVGYAITPRESMSIATKITQAGFMSPSAQTFALYLFDTSQKSAIQTKSIAITEEDSIQWFDLNWDISFDRDLGSAGQRYLIGYFEDDLTADLYDEYWTGTCANVASRIFGHYMGISPIRFPSGTLNTTYCPNLKYLVSSMNCRNSGFNLRFNAKCDITRVINQNVDMFAQSVQHQIAIRILKDCLSNYELNPTTSAENNRARWKELLTEYEGKLNGGMLEGGGYIPGLIDHLSIDFSNLDAVCFKHVKGEIHGVKWR